MSDILQKLWGFCHASRHDGVDFRQPRGRKKIAHRFIGGSRAVPAGLNHNEAKTMHSFTSCLMHCVWATKERRSLIKREMQTRLRGLDGFV